MGIELVAQPYVLFLDEPTSGLDSASSMEVCDALKTIADNGITVITVIHQPRLEIYRKFTNLLLLGKDGRTVYLGPTAQAVNYFQALGFYSEHGVNPADFLIDVTAGNVESTQGVHAKDLAMLWEKSKGRMVARDGAFNSGFREPRVSYSKLLAIYLYILFSQSHNSGCA